MSFIFPSQPVAELDVGTWTEYSGVELKIAYATNVKFLRTKQRLEQPHRRKIEAGTMDPAEVRRIMCKAMAEAILLDWRGVKNADGSDVPYSIKNAEQALLFDEALRDFVMTYSIELGNFRKEEEVHEGNS